MPPSEVIRKTAGALGVAQIDLLRAVCILLDVPLPFLPVEFRIEKDAV